MHSPPTNAQTISRAQGLLEVAKQLGNVRPSLQDHGLQPGPPLGPRGNGIFLQE